MMQRVVAACRSPAPFLAIIAAVLVLAYAPGLRGPFIFDDAVHILSNPAIETPDAKGALTSNRTDLSGRPLAMLSFALNAYLANGTSQPLPFKITNLCIHLLNAALVYWLCTLLTGSLAGTNGGHTRWQRWFPALIAGTWALHPLQLTSVLYVVQRMNSLAAVFVLGGLILFCYGRHAVQSGRLGGYALMVAGLLGGTVLGLTSKENAALLPLYALVIEYTLFRPRTWSPLERRRLWLFYAVFVALPMMLALSWLLINPELISRSYSMREFTLYERLLTEARVLWFYVSLVLLPTAQRFSLFHDDLPLSTGLLDPWTTLPAVLGLITVAAIALACRRRWPVASFAVLWFLAGHAMESSLLGLEITHEHRNYLPSVGLLFGCVYALVRALERPGIPDYVRVGLALLLALSLAASTHARARTWSTQEGIAQYTVAHHPMSPRAHALLAESYAVQQDALGALRHYRQAADLASWETSYLLRLALTAARSRVTSLDEPGLVKGGPTNATRLPRGLEIDQGDTGARLRLDATTQTEIAHALERNPVHARTAQVLDELGECIRMGARGCGQIYADVVRWYGLATRNPQSLQPIRNDMLIRMAKLCLEHADYACALETAEYARQTAPQNASFVLMQADIYYRLDRLGDSEEVLQTLRSTRLTPSLRKEADTLMALIRARRATKAD